MSVEVAAAGEVLLARSVRREVVACDVPGAGRCVRKTFLARTPLRRLREVAKGLVGGAASQREARALCALAAAGITAPRVVLEQARGFGTRQLIVTFVPGVPLVQLLGDRHRRRAVLPRVGVELRRAHEAGWVHGDPHEENVLVQDGEPVFVDWQRARRRGRDIEACIADLARFEHSMWLHAVPLGDRMRFRYAALDIPARCTDEAGRALLKRVGLAVKRRARAHARARMRRAARADRRGRAAP